MRNEIFDTIERLRASARPFCVATVVRSAGATAAKAGAKAAITETGEIIGHLGGGCVTGAVGKAAAAALDNGEVRMIRIRLECAPGVGQDQATLLTPLGRLIFSNRAGLR